MPRTLDERIADLQQKKERAEQHGRAKEAADSALRNVRAKEYAMALAAARALVAVLETLTGEGKAKP